MVLGHWHKCLSFLDSRDLLVAFFSDLDEALGYRTSVSLHKLVLYRMWSRALPSRSRVKKLGTAMMMSNYLQIDGSNWSINQTNGSQAELGVVSCFRVL